MPSDGSRMPAICGIVNEIGSNAAMLCPQWTLMFKVLKCANQSTRKWSLCVPRSPSMLYLDVPANFGRYTKIFSLLASGWAAEKEISIFAANPATDGWNCKEADSPSDDIGSVNTTWPSLLHVSIGSSTVETMEEGGTPLIGVVKFRNSTDTCCKAGIAVGPTVIEKVAEREFHSPLVAGRASETKANACPVEDCMDSETTPFEFLLHEIPVLLRKVRTVTLPPVSVMMPSSRAALHMDERCHTPCSSWS